MRPLLKRFTPDPVMPPIIQVQSTDELADSGKRNWQQEMTHAFRTVPALLNALDLQQSEAPWALDPSPAFSLLVPQPFVAKMKKQNWNDPLLLQVLPWAMEKEVTSGFCADPVGDGAAQRKPGLLQKYHGRVLLMPQASCAVHCRYCFRREFPYDSLPHQREEWEKIYGELAQDKSVEEAILSGGDPLMLSNERLKWHLNHLAINPNIKRIRFHTRVPVMLPNRLDHGFLDLVKNKNPDQQWIMVLHINHAQEVDHELKSSLAELSSKGVILLNQAVLLQNINDSLSAQIELSESLIQAGILPYYLHRLDRVQGAAHFEVPEAKGIELIEAMRQKLPGYAIPRLVREDSGANSKTPIY